jgi:hypothetical protein
MHSDPRRSRAGCIAPLAVLLASVAGCASPRAGRPLVATAALVRDELAFWQALEDVPRVAADDALHALFLLADGSADHASFTVRRAEAVGRGWLAADEPLAADDAVALGIVAVAVCDIVPVERGVSGTLFPTAPRWCVRDLAFHGLLPADRSADSTLRGLELLELLGRIEDWRAAHGGVAGAGS